MFPSSPVLAAHLWLLTTQASSLMCVLKPSLPRAEGKGCMAHTRALLSVSFISFALLTAGWCYRLVFSLAHTALTQAFSVTPAPSQPLARPQQPADIGQSGARSHSAPLPSQAHSSSWPVRDPGFLRRQDESCFLNSRGCSFQAKVKKNRS